MRSRDLTHMQLLTLPINPQDPDPADICHGRNSLVHEATWNAVPVSGRDIAVHIKSGADGDTESCEFIMPGLLVYHRTNFIWDTCFLARLWQRALHLRPELPSDPMSRWAPGNYLFCFVFCYLCKYLAHFHDLEQAISASFSAVFITGETKKRVFVVCEC